MAKKPKIIKEPKVVIPLTRDEQIQQALDKEQKSYLSRSSGNPFDIIPEVPENRYLKIGDNVEIGNLDSCVVCYITPDQKFVVVDYNNICNNYGNPISTPNIGCWPWHSVFLADNIQRTKLMLDDHTVINRFSTSGISSLIMKVLYFGVDSNPEFQRDYVWTEQDEVNLVDSIFHGRDIGKFIFLKYEWPRNDQDVLDGKQRLNAIIRFVTSQFKYKGFYWHELGRLDRHKFEDHLIQYAELDANKFNEADKLRLFLNVNIAGVPQSEEHLAKIKARLSELELNNI